MICGEQNGRLNNLIICLKMRCTPQPITVGPLGEANKTVGFAAWCLVACFLNLNDFCVWQFLRNKITDSDLTLLKVNQALGNCPFWYISLVFIRTVVPNMPTCSARVCQRSCSRLDGRSNVIESKSVGSVAASQYVSSQGPEAEAVGNSCRKMTTTRKTPACVSKSCHPKLCKLWWENDDGTSSLGGAPPFSGGADMGFIYHPPKKNNAVLSENDDNPSECGRLNDHPIWCPMPASSDKRSKSSSSSNGQSRMSKQNPAGDFQSKGAVIKPSMPYSWWLVYSLCAFMGKS